MAKAVAKFIRMSPRKLRRVINVIRGKDTGEAKTVLKFMPYAAARVIEKVLNSAIANAKQNESLNPDELKISKAFVDQSTTLRRWRAMSRGRGYPILKKTGHVTIEVVQDSSLSGFGKTKHTKTAHAKPAPHEHKHEEKKRNDDGAKRPASLAKRGERDGEKKEEEVKAKAKAKTEKAPKTEKKQKKQKKEDK